MSLTKFWPVGFLVSLVVLVMACATRATAQTWHASAPSDSGTDDRTDSQDWEQRVLKHPETQQWRPVDRETTDDQATGTPARTTARPRLQRPVRRSNRCQTGFGPIARHRRR